MELSTIEPSIAPLKLWPYKYCLYTLYICGIFQQGPQYGNKLFKAVFWLFSKKRFYTK